MQYASEKVGPKGLVIGVDLQEIKIGLPKTVHTIQADILTLEPEELLRFAPGYHLLISDAAPATTGVPFADHARSIEIARRTLTLAQAVVRPGGSWVCKIFQGEELPPFRKEAKDFFKTLAEVKPQSSRDRSVEVFLVGLGMKG